MVVQKLRKEIAKKLPKLSNLNKICFKHLKRYRTYQMFTMEPIFVKLELQKITKDILRTSRNWRCNFSNKIMSDES